MDTYRYVPAKGEGMKTYVFKVVIEPSDDRWSAYCPALLRKGAATWGYTKEEAISSIMDGQEPIGIPLEDPIEHLAKLDKFRQEEEQREADPDPEQRSLTFLSPTEKELFMQYLASVVQLVQEQQKQQQLQQAASQFGGAGPVDAGGGVSGNPPVNENELLAEDIPGGG